MGAYSHEERLAAFRKLEGKPFVLEMDNAVHAWAIAAALQLALNHPAFAPTPTAKIVRGYTKAIFETLSSHSPELCEMIEEGWRSDPP